MSIEAASAAHAASGVTYGGAAVSMAGTLAGYDLIGWIGLAVAVGGFFVNWYYRHREYRLKLREHRARMKEEVDSL